MRGDQEQPIWSWSFRDVGALRVALEEYHSDGAKVRRYGEADGTGSGSGADYDNRMLRIWRQNSEIDRRMSVLESRAPWIHRLIYAYYLQGLCGEHDGWVIAAKRCGLEANKSSRWDRDAFEHQVAWCVERLWYAK